MIGGGVHGGGPRGVGGGHGAETAAENEASSVQPAAV